MPGLSYAKNFGDTESRWDGLSASLFKQHPHFGLLGLLTCFTNFYLVLTHILCVFGGAWGALFYEKYVAGVVRPSTPKKTDYEP